MSTAIEPTQRRTQAFVSWWNPTNAEHEDVLDPASQRKDFQPDWCVNFAPEALSHKTPSNSTKISDTNSQNPKPLTNQP